VRSGCGWNRLNDGPERSRSFGRGPRLAPVRPDLSDITHAGPANMVPAMSPTPDSQGARPSPTLFVMVGLPAAGKTARAKEIEEAWQALRLTPDEWMIPLFGEPEGGKREILEGRFIWLASRALRHGISVVLDFGVWTKEERSALRFLAASVGASCELVYLEIDEMEQRHRHDKRFSAEPETTFPMSDDDLRGFREQFEAPDEAELLSSEFGPPPLSHANWSAWIADRWPTSIP
jgi:predicted kinase